VAIVEAKCSTTFQQLYDSAVRLGARIYGATRHSQASIAVLLPNSRAFVVAFLAAARLGCLFNPINPRFTPAEIRRQLVEGTAGILLTDPAHAEICRAAVAELGRPLEIMVLAGDEADDDDPVAGSGPAPPVDPDSDFLVQFSSGSTGLSKQVRRSQRNLVEEAKNFTTAAKITDTDRVLCLVPMHHAHGLGNGLLAALFSGATLVIDQLDSSSPSRSRCEAILRLLADQRISVFPGVPFLFEALSHTPEAIAVDLSALRLCFSAGNTLPKSVFDRFLARFDIAVRQLYGCTEAGSVSMNIDADPAAHWNCVGEALGSVRVTIITDDGGAVRPGVEGNVRVRSPALCSGYFGDAAATAGAFSDGAFMTGDLGTMDDQGRLFITGRRKKIIDAGGYKIDPAEVEAVLLLHEKVAEAVVVGLPALDHTELVKAVVVLKGDCTRDAILRHCGERLASYKVPAIVEFVDAIPKSALGKVLRGPLMEVAQGRGEEEVETAARTILAELLRIGPEQIDRERPLMEYGIDSARAVILAQRLQERIGLPVSATLIWSRPTLAAIASGLTSAAEPQLGRAELTSTAEPIAIIGMSCRLPGDADSPAAFWDLLAEEREAIGEIPRERWDIEAYYDADPEAPGRMATRFGGFLRGVDQFDAGFFGISPREAAAMDPQQRLFLETTWEALENACQDVSRLAGSPTGTFVGVLGDDYAFLQNQSPETLDVFSGTGSAHNIVAGRLAYLFDFRGPAVAVDTACSSSLVAVHLACQGLRTGEISMAIAGGVNLILSPPATIGLSRMRMLAPDGRCKAFDASADGFVRSEGCGVVVLKRLAEAIKAKDPVLAVIRGSAINQDGRSAGLTAPSGPAQRQVIRRALSNAGVLAEDVDYIEAHGAGTALGDPIEVEALREVYGAPSRHPCLIGAVKTNIGHTEATAGIAGLIKTVLAFDRSAIPANRHLKTVNPHLPLADTRLKLAGGLMPWPRGDRPRLAAVSSFGWSGTNAHVILQEAPAPPSQECEAKGSYLLPVSARSLEALRGLITAYQPLLEAQDLGDVCRTAGTGRTHHRHRAAAAGPSAEDVRAALQEAPVGSDLPDGGVVFVFPGQGGQWSGMGRELFREEGVFRRAIQECSEAVGAEAGWNLETAIRDGAEWRDIDRIQPALMAMGIAMTAQWRAWGIAPAVVIGHSMGEVAAAHVAGVLTLADATRVICTRSRLLKRLRGLGGMAVVEMDAAAIGAIVDTYAGAVSVAASNSERFTVVSGNLEALASLERALTVRGVYFKRIQVDVASHCSAVDRLRGDLEVALAGVEPHPATLRMMSTVEAAAVQGNEMDAHYWVRNLRQPVRFGEVIRRLVAEGLCRFLELGPHGVLLDAMQEALRGRPGMAVGSLRRGEPERPTMLHGLAQFYRHGASIDWHAVNGAPARHVALPAYAWQRERYWLEEDCEAPRQRQEEGRVIAGEREIHVVDMVAEAGHRVSGRDVVAGAVYVETALRTLRKKAGLGIWEFSGVEWSKLLEGDRPAQLIIDQDRFDVYSRAASEEAWQRHGGATFAPGSIEAPTIDIEAIRARCSHPLGEAEFYDRLAAQGLQYSGPYRQVREAWLGDGEVLARVAGARLDPCLQIVSFAAPWSSSEIRVPVRAERIVLGEGRTGEVWAWARWQDGAGHVVIADPGGQVIGQVDGLGLVRIGWAQEDSLWSLEWERSDEPQLASLQGHWLVVGEGAEELALHLRKLGAACHAALEVGALAQEDPWRGLVLLADHDRIETLAELVRLLPHRISRDGFRLFVVTRGVQAAGDGVETVAGAGFWGAGRTLMYEHPEYGCTLIDSTADTKRLAQEIAAAGNEEQVALRPEGRYVARLRAMRDAADAVETTRPAGKRPFRLEIDAPSTFDRLVWRETAPRLPRRGEAVVAVAAGGLNFLDALWSLGEYPGQQNGQIGLGREFAGTIVAIGPDVEDLLVGDDVVGCAEEGLASHVVCNAALLARMPERLSPSDASAQPIAYATAYYALTDLARLQGGEKVLIHSAASGTGLAATHIALSIGAQVWATASTPEKRDFLRSLGVDHVMDSRSTAFAREIFDRTTGRGVDVVLNSLSGKPMQASLDATAAYGRFVELGKRDLWGKRWLRSEPFRKNLSYFAVDLAAMARDRPDRFGQTLKIVTEGIQEGKWPPLPVRVFEPKDVGEAFRTLAVGRHVGKLAVSLRHPETVPIVRRRGIAADATYLVTGGLGGLGLRLADWFVEQGARHLLLVGRRPPSSEALSAIETMRTKGATVRAAACDVGDLAALSALIATLDPPLRGVIHAAAELADVSLEKLTPAQVKSVWRPKALGAFNLHEATAGQALDFFVVMSSVAALLGSPGQAHYAAANAWADALIGLRRRQGLPGLAIHWGPWGEIGLAAASALRGSRLADRGMSVLAPDHALAMLGRLLWDKRAQAAVMRLDLRQWEQYYPRTATSRMLAAMRRDATHRPASASLRPAIEAAVPQARRILLEDCVRSQMARVLRLDPGSIPATAPFSTLGFDSLLAIEFRNRLEATLGLTLSATIVWAHPTLPQLVAHLAEGLGLDLPADQLAEPFAAERRVAAISEEEAEAELLERLAVQ
jgi:acyl transferase domain-containing protein/acyl-CoA synthetase (AMP-forming)/AMP-acid ligase II/acyl carrier protein